MTRQETFDKVVRAVIAQGRPSMRGGACAYRGDDGCKCAAGHLIPDEKYDPVMEGATCTPTEGDPSYFSPTARMANRVATVLREEGHTPVFVRELQRAHDAASGSDDFVASFKRRVRRVAHSYDLNTAALDAPTTTEGPTP